MSHAKNNIIDLSNYKMNILILYNSTQTYTNTVYEHLSSFANMSVNSIFYCHQDSNSYLNLDLNIFHAVIIHYSIRLPFNQLSNSAVERLKSYNCLKVLFIQDEYDNTLRAWYWIKLLGIQLVFTVVPAEGVETVYPVKELPGVRFVSNFTGYVPDSLLSSEKLILPSKRKLLVGYRGRPLPVHYGLLGQEKVAIGKLVKKYCTEKHVPHDIEWTEDARIYGPDWYKFMASCRSMLGSESGSNVFDWDGTLASKIATYKQQHPTASDDELYSAVIKQYEQHGLMNQISPRVFESIALRTLLVLFEGKYSGVLVPGVHFIPLKKDGSNLDEVFRLLNDSEFVDEMVSRAYEDIILSGKYSYRTFVQMVDAELSASFEALTKVTQYNQYTVTSEVLSPITTFPIRATPPSAVVLGFLNSQTPFGVLLQKLYNIWIKLPQGLRDTMKPALKAVIKR